MAKIINGRTVSAKHEDLIGQKLMLDGWCVEICDTIESDDGTIYVAVRVNAIAALYLQQRWHRYITN